MMEQAGDIVKDALKEISKLGAESPVNATDAQDSIRYMNRMMATLDARGMPLGYTEVDSLGDDVTTPVWSYQPIVFLLAATLWGQYNHNKPIPVDLAQKANGSIKTLRGLLIKVGPASYPCDLPVGSGNEQEDSSYHFYPCDLNTILTETQGAIALEDNTNG